MDYSGAQKCYNPYFNEWDCCKLWGSSIENEGFIEIQPVAQQEAIVEEYAGPATHCPLSPCQPHSPSPVPPHRSPSPPELPMEMEALDVTAHIVLDDLTMHHSFVSPTPLPTSQSPPSILVSASKAKSFLLLLGRSNISPNDGFFLSSLARLCVDFMNSLTGSNPGSPNLDLWDLFFFFFFLKSKFYIPVPERSPVVTT
jgi:hypothetical protein